MKTQEEIIEILKDRNPASKKFVENGLDRSKMLSPEEQEKLLELYSELFRPKIGTFVHVGAKIVQFLIESYGVEKYEAVAIARGNAENSLLYFRDFRDNKVFEDAEDVIMAAKLFAFWDLLRYIVGLHGFETLN